jgi:hypothetical protein
MRRLIAVIVLVSGASTLAYAQTPTSMYGDLQASLAAAQAGAIRPGDEALSCEALEHELVAAVKQPEVQSFVAKAGAAGQERMAAMNEAGARAAAPSALTLFSSIVPFGGWAGLGVAAAQAQAQQAQAARNIQQQMQQAQDMMGIMPTLMRGQRVMELAQTRNCAWLQEGSRR